MSHAGLLYIGDSFSFKEIYHIFEEIVLFDLVSCKTVR